MPRRVQRKRTKGWRMPPGAVYVGRPTRYGNPYSLSEFSVEVSMDLFTQNILPELDLLPLRGKDLACWCSLDSRCHADVLLEAANR